MTATETKGETTVTVASYTDDSCKQESNKTESLSLKTLEDNYKLKYQELTEVPFAYGMTMPDDTKCPRKDSILTMYIGTGCISSKYKDLGIEQSLRYKMIKNHLHVSYYAGSATCEGTAVESTSACDVCAEMTVELCIQVVDEMEKYGTNDPFPGASELDYDAMREKCREQGNYGQYLLCGKDESTSSSVSVFILAALVLLVFLF